jgi:hypothetical protein
MRVTQGMERGRLGFFKKAVKAKKISQKKQSRKAVK